MKIDISPSEKSINSALEKIKQYKQDFLGKVERFRELVAKEVQAEAQKRFNEAIVADIIGDPIKASVDVTVNHDGGNITTVIANGEDAVWVEFGAGVYHNGSVGTSPHPEGSNLGMTIGSYGKGNGKKQTWGYWEGDELVLTHGAPAVMPMYNALKDVAGRIDEIAREVFK